MDDTGQKYGTFCGSSSHSGWTKAIDLNYLLAENDKKSEIKATINYEKRK